MYKLQMSWGEEKILKSIEELKNVLIQECVEVIAQNFNRYEDFESKANWAKTIVEMANANEQHLLELAKDMGHNFYFTNDIIADEELEELNEQYKNGEIYCCECLEKLINKYITEKDDFENNIEQSTIDAMFSLNRSAQINDWDGETNDLYRKTQKYLLNKLGLEFANGRIERKQ